MQAFRRRAPSSTPGCSPSSCSAGPPSGSSPPGTSPSPPDFARQYEPLVERRIGREPLAYIVGQQEFWGLPFEVSPAVLIPRSRDRADRRSRAGAVSASRRGPDRRRCRVPAAAASPSRSRPNGRQRKLPRPTSRSDRAGCRATERAAPRRRRPHSIPLRRSARRPRGPFDLITCNPPYVAERDRPGLQPEVRDHEPDVALFGGRDGFHLVERLVAMRPDCLAARRIPAVRVRPRPGRAGRVARSRDTAGLRLVELRRDLQGIARTAIVER